MRTGLTISLTAHAALILWAVLGGWFLSPRESDVIKVADVSVISEAEFDAAVSGAPEPSETEVAELTPPAVEVAPELPAEEAAPEIPREVEKAEPVEDVSAAPAVSLETAEVDQPEAPGSEIARPGAESGEAVPAPRPQAELTRTTPVVEAPRIDTAPAPKPPKPVETAEVVEEKTAPVEETVEPAEKAEDAAPKEAAPEITLEKEAERATTPKVAARPKGRPKRLKAQQDQPVKTAEAKVKPEVKPAAKPAAKPKAQPERPAQVPSRYVLGSDMSRSEKFSISGQIEKKWNIASFEGRPNWETLVVIVEVQLTQAGKVISKVKPVEPKAPSGDFKVAFQAARRAILQGQPYNLPTDKFRDGDWLRIRFNPAQGGVTLN